MGKAWGIEGGARVSDHHGPQGPGSGRKPPARSQARPHSRAGAHPDLETLSTGRERQSRARRSARAKARTRQRADAWA
eukprot:6060457-Prymnesium_polylepis.1